MTTKTDKSLPHEESTQIAIIGGGSAGICCAIALRQLGIQSVTVVEFGGYQKFRIGESIPPESKQIFVQLGIWQNFLSQNHLPCYGSRSWWGDARRGYNDSILNPHGHGWHLDRVGFNRFLADEAINQQVKLKTNCRYQSFFKTNSHAYRLQLKTENRIEYLNADFVIDASGAKGVFAKQQNSKKLFSDALICSAQRFNIIDHEHPLSGQTHIEAVNSGWWYAARLPGEQLLISHTTDKETFKQLQMKSSKHWLEELQRATHSKNLLRGTQPASNTVDVYAAPSFILDKMYGDYWLALGDAAASYDPVTSQGLFKSMTDALFAAGFIAELLFKNRNILADYQKAMVARHRQYRQMREYYYRQETRFPASCFWKKMQSESMHSENREEELISV